MALSFLLFFFLKKIFFFVLRWGFRALIFSACPLSLDGLREARLRVFFPQLLKYELKCQDFCMQIQTKNSDGFSLASSLGAGAPSRCVVPERRANEGVFQVGKEIAVEGKARVPIKGQMHSFQHIFMGWNSLTGSVTFGHNGENLESE